MWVSARLGADHRGAATESVAALAEKGRRARCPRRGSRSPRRVEFQLGLIGDRIADEVTADVLNLMAAWMRWLGERGDLPDYLREQVVAATAPRTSDAVSR